MHEADKGFPFYIVKEGRTGHKRGFTAEPGEVMNPPRHHHIDGQAVFQTSGGTQLPVLNPATAFEHAEVNFNTPAPGIAPVFGRGHVRRLSGRGPSARAVVVFERAGEKTLVVAQAKLSPIGE